MNEAEIKTRVNGNGSQPTTMQVPAHNGATPDRAQTYPNSSLRSLRAEAEISAISRALENTGWNRKQAARLLCISYRGLLYKIRQHNLTPVSRSGMSTLGSPLKAE